MVLKFDFKTWYLDNCSQGKLPPVRTRVRIRVGVSFKVGRKFHYYENVMTTTGMVLGNENWANEQHTTRKDNSSCNVLCYVL